MGVFDTLANKFFNTYVYSVSSLKDKTPPLYYIHSQGLSSNTLFVSYTYVNLYLLDHYDIL